MKHWIVSLRYGSSIDIGVGFNWKTSMQFFVDRLGCGPKALILQKLWAEKGAHKHEDLWYSIEYCNCNKPQSHIRDERSRQKWLRDNDFF